MFGVKLRLGGAAVSTSKSAISKDSLKLLTSLPLSRALDEILEALGVTLRGYLLLWCFSGFIVFALSSDSAIPKDDLLVPPSMNVSEGAEGGSINGRLFAVLLCSNTYYDSLLRRIPSLCR